MPSTKGDKELRIVSQSSPTGTQFFKQLDATRGKRIMKVYVSSGEGSTSEGIS